MAVEIINDLILDVSCEPPESDVKRQKLIEYVLTGNSKQYLGKDYAEKRVNKLSAEEVDKLFSIYEAKLGTLRQGSRNTFQKKMFQYLNNSIYHSILTIFGGIKDNGGFNPKPLKLRDFSVLSVVEHAQIVWKLQRQFCKGKHQL